MKRQFLTLILFFITMTSSAYELHVVTEDFAPYSYKENGHITGISVEIVQALLKDLDVQAEIRIYPFKRAMELAKTQKNTLIFSIIRTDDREHLFKWVGQLAPITTGLFRLKKRHDIEIHRIQDIAQYQVSDVQGSAVWEHLKHYGIDVFEIPSTAQNIQMLKLGRVDLTSTVELNFYHIVRQLRYSPESFEMTYVFEELSNHLWLAFNKDTDDDIVNDFRRALGNFKTSLMFKALHKKYNPNLKN
ncbi:substrate-binding periplasmic protein [Litoribrevibacter euphylliae]|uniref:Substrate-binding periplasmic protein n=1 Tax=Litoribrevibacter euphylliae TaxID=1834034 RepID=A0ABV7H8Y7_9GAMM